MQNANEVKAWRTGIYEVEPSPEGMKTVLGEDGIAGGFSDYLRDESRVQAKGTDALFFPRSVENIAFVLERARAQGERVTLSGGRTGICAGAVPLSGEYLLSLERMNRVLGLEREGNEYRLTAEAGLRLSELNQRIATKDLGISSEAAEEFAQTRAGYFYPPDPTEQTASLGGTVATNASGARTLFFGPTREYVTAVDVVLATGELLRVRRGEIREEEGVFRVPRQRSGELLIPAPSYGMPKTKNTAGLFSRKAMDLIDLFIGCEGILGVIASATVRLLKEPALLAGGLAFFPGESEALEFVRRARGSAPRPLALEYFDENALSLLEQTRRKQGPTSEIPALPEIEPFPVSARSSGTRKFPEILRTPRVLGIRGVAGCAVYFESALFPLIDGAGTGGSSGVRTDVHSTAGDRGAEPAAAEGVEAASPEAAGISEHLRHWQTLIKGSGGDPRIAWGAVTKRDIQRLKTFRHALPETVNEIVSDNKRRDERIHKVGTDIAVPDDRLEEIMSVYRSSLGEAGIDFVVFGHIGNNHVHVNMLPRSYEQLLEAKRLYVEFARKAVEMGGSVSAEHGIGKLKKEYLALQYPPGAFDEMRAVKKALDPEGILNPGDVL